MRNYFFLFLFSMNKKTDSQSDLTEKNQENSRTSNQNMLDLIVSLFFGVCMSGLLLVGYFWLNLYLMDVVGMGFDDYSDGGGKLTKLLVIIPIIITALCFWLLVKVRKFFYRKGRKYIGDGLFAGIFIPFLLFGACTAIIFRGG